MLSKPNSSLAKQKKRYVRNFSEAFIKLKFTIKTGDYIPRKIGCARKNRYVRNFSEAFIKLKFTIKTGDFIK